MLQKPIKTFKNSLGHHLGPLGPPWGPGPPMGPQNRNIYKNMQKYTTIQKYIENI